MDYSYKEIMDEINKRSGTATEPESSLPSSEESFVETAPELENQGVKIKPVETVLDFNGKNLRRVEADPIKNKLKIEKMTKCLHGRSCEYLSFNGEKNICQAAGCPVWDLVECPLMWWAEKQPKLIKEIEK
jgi:hypothetical protein